MMGDDHQTTAYSVGMPREMELLEKLLTQRLRDVERAVIVAHEDLVRVPTEVQKAVSHLDSLMAERLLQIREHFKIHDERFSSIEKQFSERDVRTEQTARDSKVAVDAALQAAEKAVGKQQEASEKAINKSEAAFTKQFDQLALLIAANTKALDDKVTDLKERFSAMSGESLGHMTTLSVQRDETRTNTGQLNLIIGSVIGFFGIVAGILLHFYK